MTKRPYWHRNQPDKDSRLPVRRRVPIPGERKAGLRVWIFQPQYSRLRQQTFSSLLRIILTLTFYPLGSKVAPCCHAVERGEYKFLFKAKPPRLRLQLRSARVNLSITLGFPQPVPFGSPA